MNLILEKFRLRQKFACGNELVNPPDVLGIKITKSEKPLGLGHSDYYKLEYRDLWRKLEDQEDVTNKFAKYIPEAISEPIQLSKSVFIVHGKDHKPLKELKAMLGGFGLSPIVLHEKASGSRTIVEKLEKYSDVGYTFVILTPDDVGGIENEFSDIMTQTGAIPHWIAGRDPHEAVPDILLLMRRMKRLMHYRSRQNVVLEFGFFIGSLGRDRVCCLYKGDIELPSDMQGIVYIRFKESVNEIRDRIIEELDAAGYKIPSN